MLCRDEGHFCFALEICYFQSPLAGKGVYDLHHHGEIQFPAGLQILGLKCQLSCVVALILVLLSYLLYFSQEELKWKKETGALQYISASVLICWILTELLWSQIFCSLLWPLVLNIYSEVYRVLWEGSTPAVVAVTQNLPSQKLGIWEKKQ